MRPDARLNYSRMDARRGQLRESDSGRGRRIIRAVGASNKVLQDPRRRHLNGGVCVGCSQLEQVRHRSFSP